MTIFARNALLTSGWSQDTRIEMKAGQVNSIATEAQALPGDVHVDTLLPALSNLHSHSFQRAMAGMTEYKSQGHESFWTWRDLMYRFLDNLTPVHVEAFAAQTFMEMQMAGYAAVGEFHYLHHQKSGAAYTNLAEHSERIMAAASTTGIGLTHLPVLYTYGDTTGAPVSGGQRRFYNDLDQFQKLFDGCIDLAKSLPDDARIGIAPHSLRATNPDDLSALLDTHSDVPIHIHIAEQTKEVDEVIAKLGARPVEWLLENAHVNERWCLVHATHMTKDETKKLAASGAVAGLCPITEANLGDGIFNGAEYLKHDGAFGVGSDSNVNISLTEELRTLEYSQRLRDQQRNVLAPNNGHTGHAIYLGAAAGGARALSRNSGAIEIGKTADLVAIDRNHPTLCALNNSQLLDGLVFAAKDQVVTDLWSAGRHCVRSGKHVAQDTVSATFQHAIRDLVDRL